MSTANIVRFHRVLRSTPERVYRAFLDAEAKAKWLTPYEVIRYTDKFEDPNLPGEMEVTVTLKAVSCGTEVHITQEGIPEMIPAEAYYVGWQESLSLLGLLVEAEVSEG